MNDDFNIYDFLDSIYYSRLFIKLRKKIKFNFIKSYGIKRITCTRKKIKKC